MPAAIQGIVSGSELDWEKTLIGTDQPEVIKEVAFLKAASANLESAEALGQIDMVLVNRQGPALAWCCVEMQGVYFSGRGMEPEFAAMRAWNEAGIPFPLEVRRLDFRSSGPKRLMPQLQIKVPTISRWGKDGGSGGPCFLEQSRHDVRSASFLKLRCRLVCGRLSTCR